MRATAPIRYKYTPMIRWLIVIFLALVLLQGVWPWLRKMGLGALPGDLRFRLFGREFYFPFATTVVLSLLAAAVARLL